MLKKDSMKVIIAVVMLLFVFSILLSLFNLKSAIDLKQDNLREQALPLSMDNVYTEIQKMVIEPNVMASMMANDTFVKDWLLETNADKQKIQRYLAEIQKQYGFLATFAVSDRTLEYFTEKGLVEILNFNNPENKWYLNFKKNNKDFEINLDSNQNIGQSMILFINHKIHHKDKMIGATGVAIEIKDIDAMLRRFQENYAFSVYFIDQEGEVVLSQNHKDLGRNLFEKEGVTLDTTQFLKDSSSTFEYSQGVGQYLMIKKYIPELDSHLLIKADLADFTQQEYRVFYFNLVVSLLVTAIISIMILFMFKRYNRKLENLAQKDSLTEIANRRSFNSVFEKAFHFSNRHDRQLSVMFLDIDDFKHINDNLGHQAGDAVLKRIADILTERLRLSDVIARWGGEEFIVGLLNTDLADAETIAETIRQIFESDLTLQSIAKRSVTASFGVTSLLKEDSFDGILSRVDDAMYLSKQSGKNKVSSL